ncbi:helix-turn-helix domain-containing protein [Oerskovia turbata]
MDTTTQRAVAQAVRVQRVRSGLASEADLARKAGYHPSALSKRLTGDLRMNLDDVDRLARALGVDPYDLMRLAREESGHLAA